jgi:voltage-gated potassium channel
MDFPRRPGHDPALPWQERNSDMTRSDAPSLRRRAAIALDPELHKGRGLSRTNAAMVVLIVLSIVFGILETEPMLTDGRQHLFLGLEIVLTAIFAVEYAVRAWASIENPRYPTRWAYVRSPVALLDLAAVLVIVVSFVHAEGFLFRLLRLLRLLRLARIGRFSHAWETICVALRRRRHELILSVMVTAVLLVITSSLLYLVEGSAQPQDFGSIPRAMWWSVATLTTVGYGDVVPMTPFGRILGAMSAVIGIGLIAMPAGILAAAFSDVMRAGHQEETDPDD